MKENQGEIKKSAGKIIKELSKAADIYFKAEFKKYSIGHAQIRTLIFLAYNEGISQLELSRSLNLDKSSITSQLQTLEKNGYIRREISEIDARTHRLNITDKTRKILDPLKKVFSSWTEILLDGFDAPEKARIFYFLEKMQDNVQKNCSRI